MVAKAVETEAVAVAAATEVEIVEADVLVTEVAEILLLVVENAEPVVALVAEETLDAENLAINKKYSYRHKYINCVYTNRINNCM